MNPVSRNVWLNHIPSIRTLKFNIVYPSLRTDLSNGVKKEHTCLH